MKPWVKYSLVRVGVFALAFGVMLAVGVIWWLAAPIAPVISFCVAYIFFRPLRDAVTADLVRRRTRPAAADSDALAEDAAENRTEKSSSA